MSPEPSDARRTGRRVRLFAIALVVFGAWVLGLGVMAYTSAEGPHVEQPVPASPRPE